MSTLAGALRGLSPHSLLRLYTVVVLGAAALAIGVVLWTTAAVDTRTREAASMAKAAAAASQVQAGLREPMMPLLLNTARFLLSDDTLEGLTAAQRARLLEAVSSAYAGEEPPPGGPEVLLPMSENEAVALHRSIDQIAAQVDQLMAEARGIDLTDVAERSDRLHELSRAHFEGGSFVSLAALLNGVLLLGEALDGAVDRLTAGVATAQGSLSQATSQARFAMLTALVLLTATMALATFLIGRLISRAFQSGEEERAELSETSETLRYRNNQLNALYAVFSEITHNLSMRYVVSAALRETLRVMDGMLAVLRLIQAGELVPVGNLTSDGRELANLPILSLGEGPTGRVARRGRSIRINQGAQEQANMNPPPEEGSARIESGVIVPLIVGARVVGTLAVWSEQINAFTDEDEHVLEMIASQVATAVIAAESAENSERRALHDPLTGLPNRRRLSEDIARYRGSLEDSGLAAVAMIDVDRFKSVNDEYGHRVGDVALQRIASVLRSALREGDMIYRYGGEEFVAIFQGVSGPDALTAAERLRQAVEAVPVTGNQPTTAKPVSVSIGVALMPDHGTDLSQLIERADRAMYQAKDKGRNRVQLWEEEARGSGVLPTVA